MQASPSPIGKLLRHWRKQRGMSQLDLSLEAEVSTRHLSFVETGRSSPSREMVLILGSVLDVPLRERNALLHAAGYTSEYRESSFDEPSMEPIRRLLGFILERHEPYPVVVVDPWWNPKLANRAQLRLTAWLMGDAATPHATPPNLMASVFDPDGLRPLIVNLETLGPCLLNRLHRDAVTDVRSRELLEECLAFPGIPDAWRRPVLHPPSLLVPMELLKDGVLLKLYSTITTLGTPQDVTVQEVRIETFFPADESTDAFLRKLAEGSPRS